MSVTKHAMLARLEERVEAPLRTSMGTRGRVVVVALSALVVLGIIAWVTQLANGLAVTGMTDRVSWGLYVANFVFFIGISMAGTLVSAVLRLTSAEWRRPITRIAEMITVVALVIAATMIVVDMGRPDRLLNVLLHPHLRSPILWDVLSVSTYLVGSALYLYLPLIPDLSRLRGLAVPPWKRALYRTLSLGWAGLPEQRERLERGIAIMAIAIIPTAISVHTVTAWIFGMTAREGWNSTIFGPYFVVGALYSGIAAIIVVVAIVRRTFHLEEFITERHIRLLGTLMLVSALLYAYFTLSEYVTIGYKLAVGDEALLHHLFSGPFAAVFWTIMLPGTVIPIVMLSLPRTRTLRWIVVASILANIGMWLKRYVIVVPSLALPQMPVQWGIYRPTWVEWSITAAAFAAFALLLILFSRLFPIVSVWEFEEGLEATSPLATRARKRERERERVSVGASA